MAYDGVIWARDSMRLSVEYVLLTHLGSDGIIWYDIVASAASGEAEALWIRGCQHATAIVMGNAVQWW